MNDLAKQKCKSCEGGVAPLTPLLALSLTAGLLALRENLAAALGPQRRRLGTVMLASLAETRRASEASSPTVSRMIWATTASRSSSQSRAASSADTGSWGMISTRPRPRIGTARRGRRITG